MARDYRHGHGHKQAFQRKSQQAESQENEKRSVSLIWGAGFLVSAILLVGFFVTEHFVSKGAKSSEQTGSNIFQSALEEKQATEAPVDEVSKPLQPLPQPKSQPNPKGLMVNEVVVPEVTQAQGESDSVSSTQRQYSFYQGLSQTEVVVEAEQISVELTQPYYIQAGSFGTEATAKQEQKRLAKHGLKLEISALNSGKRTYYRLRVGPFKDRLDMNKRRNELRKFGVDTLLIKAPKATP